MPSLNLIKASLFTLWKLNQSINLISKPLRGFEPLQMKNALELMYEKYPVFFEDLYNVYIK